MLPLSFFKRSLRIFLLKNKVKIIFPFFLFYFLQITPSLFCAEEFPVAGYDPLFAEIVEDHSQALMAWAKKGIQNAVVINVDAHDDLGWIEAEKIDRLAAIKQSKDWQALQSGQGPNGLYHAGSFLYAAYKLNIISRVYWVIPFSYFQVDDPAPALNRFLSDYGFLEKDIDSFTLEQGCYQGSRFGVPLVICGIESLPSIEGPVVLTIDADFFPSFSCFYNQDILTSISTFLRVLAEKEYQIQDVTIARSVDGGFLSIARRWIAEYLAAFLQNPKKMSASYPKDWLVRGLADIYYQNNQYYCLIDLINRFPEQRDQDFSLMVYHSFALFATGEREKAFDLACKIAAFDNRYAYLLADLGQWLIDYGEIDQALRYFQKAYQINPKMNFRQKNLAEALAKAGRYKEASYYYKIYQEKNGPFPAAFALGWVKLKIGRDDQAGAWFERGLNSLKNNKYFFIDSQTDIKAIQKAVSYFKQQKAEDKAEFIVTHPALNRFFE